MSKSEKSEYQLIIFHETPKAWMVGREKKDRDVDRAFWLPRSQVDLDLEFSQKGTTYGNFMIPEWLAEEKGLDASLEALSLPSPDEDGGLIE